MASGLGDFLLWVGASEARPALDGLADERLWPPVAGATQPRGVNLAPGAMLWHRGDVALRAGEIGGIALGRAPCHGGPLSSGADAADALLASWNGRADSRFDVQLGRYSQVLWNLAEGRVVARTDPFRTCPIYHARVDGGWLLASDLRLILRTGLVTRRVSPAAVYQFLNFSYIAAPLTAIEGISKLPAGEQWVLEGGRESTSRYWDARYPADLQGSEASRVAALRDRIESTVRDFRCADASGWGTFLSGGTDSSSISGILARAHDKPLDSFSIGFAEQGYDELGFSQIASQAFGLNPHEYRVSEQDAVQAIGHLVKAYDEPFGNASAIPTYYCAKIAADHGVSMMIAGDGGDEIFGGNERYLKDKIFEAFHTAPGWVRGIGEAAAGALKGVDNRFANRVKNFVRRGSLPNPDRFYSDDSFASDHFEELLTPGFRARVGIDDALDVQRRIYARAEADCTLHRLMYLDLKLTIADNDVVKVVRASRSAGVDVMFPYLDPRLVEFTGHLPGSDKVRGSNKRHLFKLATEQILPEAIRKKKKQGFGLPISVWLRRNGPYGALAHDVVLSDRALQRGYANPDYIRRLIGRHESGAWDHSAEIHSLMMLELWHREFVDA